MLSHCAEDAGVRSYIPHNQATAHAQKEFHSPADKDGRVQKEIFRKGPQTRTNKKTYRKHFPLGETTLSGKSTETAMNPREESRLLV